MKMGSARFGAISLNRDEPGPLSPGQLSLARTAASTAMEVVLSGHSGVAPGSLPPVLDSLAQNHAVVHQATGMILVQMVISAEDALMVLRVRAFGANRPIQIVAADVVAGRICFDR
ncbi:MAG: ANTAR domain-containing protein, partial [Acidimicrobiales bacterium]